MIIDAAELENAAWFPVASQPVTACDEHNTGRDFTNRLAGNTSQRHNANFCSAAGDSGSQAEDRLPLRPPQRLGDQNRPQLAQLLQTALQCRPSVQCTGTAQEQWPQTRRLAEPSRIGAGDAAD